ncbi:hypothetical protein OGX83_17065 [Citrobacter sp. Cpo074]|uniref:hypothetical protein n=1 Tax=Citrobacter sp. Cpo074 TaxID=2985135 RepID=UPI0025758CFC|nr:hypothetical protein [Citrobacter sp. Cpo074]MDM2850195.1 hypothetical protein [Citrobacter sp. Cpo074]
MTSREKFEAWCKTVMSDDADFHMEWGMYANLNIRTRWEAWKASESASEQKLTDMAVQLANAESKCRELQRDNDSLEAVAVSMRDDMRDARENLEELDNALCELLPGTQYMDPPDGGSVTPLEQVRRMVADYRERIEELESRTVRISRPKIGRLHGALLHLWSEYDVQSAVEHAGIKFKVED